jgi:hypothetical protein
MDKYKILQVCSKIFFIIIKNVENVHFYENFIYIYIYIYILFFLNLNIFASIQIHL